MRIRVSFTSTLSTPPPLVSLLPGEWCGAAGAGHLHGDRAGQSAAHPHPARGVALPAAHELALNSAAGGARIQPGHVEPSVRHRPLLRRALRHRCAHTPTRMLFDSAPHHSIINALQPSLYSVYCLLGRRLLWVESSRLRVSCVRACRSRRPDAARRSARLLRCCTHLAPPQCFRMHIDSLRLISSRIFFMFAGVHYGFVITYQSPTISTILQVSALCFCPLITLLAALLYTVVPLTSVDCFPMHVAVACSLSSSWWYSSWRRRSLLCGSAWSPITRTSTRTPTPKYASIRIVVFFCVLSTALLASLSRLYLLATHLILLLIPHSRSARRHFHFCGRSVGTSVGIRILTRSRVRVRS